MAVDLKNGVVLRLGFKQDRTYEYTLTTTVRQEVKNQGNVVNQENNTFRASLKQRVLRVEDDGSAHVLSVTQPEATTPNVSRQVIYQHSSDKGSVLETSGPNPGNSFTFPDGKVSEGDSWTGESRMPVPGRPDPVVGKTNYTILGSEQVNGHHCVKIGIETEQYKFEMPLPDGSGRALVTMDSQGTMFFAPEEGLVVKMELTTHSSPRMGPLVINSENVITQELVGFKD